MISGEDVLKERVAGTSTRAIARKHGRTVAEINQVLDAVNEPITPEYKVRAISVELERLDALQAVFHARAVEGDADAGHLCLRISERRSNLLGLDQPAKFDIIELRAAAQPQPSSVDKIMKALEDLRATSGSGNGSVEPQN